MRLDAAEDLWALDFIVAFMPTSVVRFGDARRIRSGIAGIRDRRMSIVEKRKADSSAVACHRLTQSFAPGNRLSTPTTFVGSAVEHRHAGTRDSCGKRPVAHRNLRN